MFFECRLAKPDLSSRSGHFSRRPFKSRVSFPIGKSTMRHILDPKDIGAIVRSKRKASCLQQDKLAGAAGVGLRFIVDPEAG